MSLTQTADLHIHTSFSDGSDAPQEVVAIALEKELRCIAITDHDSVDGIEPAVNAAHGTGLEVIAGVELSTEWAGADIHILGYCFHARDAVFRERLAMFRDVRLERVRKMTARLRELGLAITDEDVLALSGDGAVGRPHVAQAIVNKGYVKTGNAAFDMYIGEGCPAYVAKFKQTPYEAINLIHQAGGVAVMAHPMITLKDELIAGFVKAGMDGLEVYYPNTSKRVIAFYEGLARSYGLLMTGGSDSHGRYRRYSPIGMVRVNDTAVEELKIAAARYQGLFCR